VTLRDADIDRFVARLRARLAAGAVTYGDTSFTRPAAELVHEVQQELEDVCGWSLLLWLRIDCLRGRVENASQRVSTKVSQPPASTDCMPHPESRIPDIPIHVTRSSMPRDLHSQASKQDRMDAVHSKDTR